MRNLKRREQTIRWLSPSTTTGALGSVVSNWSGTPTSIKAFVQPLSSSHFRAEYGERADRMKLAIVANGDYAIGDGVWLESETGNPPWMIVSVDAWLDLTNLTLEKRE